MIRIGLGKGFGGVLCLLSMCRLSAPAEPYGLASRPPAKAYLNMPETAEGQPPKLLSQTGAFTDTRNLMPSSALIPYVINVSFWSDGAAKSRWISVPNEGTAKTISFKPSGEWSFPAGTVFAKHFEFATDESHPEQKRRLETRLLVCDRTGTVYGVTYKWRADNSDADLLATNLIEPVIVKTPVGTKTQNWFYPSRQDCRVCHTYLAGGVLGVNTRQMNCEFQFPKGIKDNQLRAWNHVGLFNPTLREEGVATFAKLAAASDTSRPLEDRARSYLDANCAQCHRPGGTVAYFDARYDTPLAQQGLLGGQVLIDENIDGARAIAPKDRWRSIVFLRMSRLEGLRMPPLAHETLDHQGIALIQQWIESLPGPRVLPPPAFAPPPGEFKQPVTVTLSETTPGATIHYTLDGSAPTKSDPAYEHPIKITEPTVLRAKAFKSGLTKSITVQAVYIIGQ